MFKQMNKQFYFLRDYKNFPLYRMFIFLNKIFKDPRTGHHKLIDTLFKFSSQTPATICEFFAIPYMDS